MSSTPPKKGSKRPVPQTPRGKLPAKDSRTSSPTEVTGIDDLLAGRPSPSKIGDITISILKFTAVPTVTNDGRQVSEDLAYSFLRKHPEWKDVRITEKPQFIRPKHNPDSLCATFQVKVEDTLKASVAKKL